MADEITVDIWSDVTCPWCAIGSTQFFKAVEQLGSEMDVEVRYMPFELNPDMKAQGENQTQLLAAAYQKPIDEIEAMGTNMEEAADKAGFSMVYAGEGAEPERKVWNTHDAHKLLRWALSVADPAAQVKLKMAFFAAHFQKRRNISDREVLLEITEAQGFDRAAAAIALDDEALSIAVKMEEKRGLENKISSVPTFVVAGKYILQGSAEPENFAQALVKIASMEAMA